jgi:hypothetical protein
VLGAEEHLRDDAELGERVDDVDEALRHRRGMRNEAYA